MSDLPTMFEVQSNQKPMSIPVRPDQNLWALLRDLQIDITDGRFIITKIGEWDDDE